MEECKWNFYFLRHYFRLTKNNYFKIIGKRGENWKDIVKIKIIRIMVTWKDSNNQYYYDSFLKYIKFRAKSKSLRIWKAI